MLPVTIFLEDIRSKLKRAPLRENIRRTLDKQNSKTKKVQYTTKEQIPVARILEPTNEPMNQKT